jgi:hypothetical protein
MRERIEIEKKEKQTEIKMNKSIDIPIRIENEHIVDLKEIEVKNDVKKLRTPIHLLFLHTKQPPAGGSHLIELAPR